MQMARKQNWDSPNQVRKIEHMTSTYDIDKNYKKIKNIVLLISILFYQMHYAVVKRIKCRTNAWVIV